VVVAFANTGKEREETLRFVHECGSRWGVTVHWVEYRNDERGYEVVGLNSAARNGEPFAALVAKKANEGAPAGYVPNRGAPYCSIELKARTVRDWVYGELGWKPKWKVALGLRHDEQARVMGAIGRNASGKDPWRNVLPLDAAKVSKADVLAWWRAQPFDLGLLNYQGNCTRCWKKSEAKRRRIIRDEQEGVSAPDPWWSEQERLTGTTFDLKLSHADLEQQVRDEPMFGLEPFDDDDPDEECGFTCFVADADQMDVST
jgi:3'-phosphoadenosine 5'-phosphosulfate sulfotransferase (PAPS reductase)/FAD synthetase